MAIMLALLGLASIGYGVTVMAIHSGSSFFVVWYALGALLLATAEALRSGAWRLLPPAVLRGGAALLVCLALTLAATQGLALSQLEARGEPDLDYVVVLGAQIYDDGSPSPVLLTA